MNTAIKKLAGSIGREDSLDEYREEDLRSLAESYPYLVPAQLLLCRKMRKGDPSLYQQQLQKTGLYFINPLWLQRFLSDDKVTGSAEAILMPERLQEEIAEDEITEEEIIEEEIFEEESFDEETPDEQNSEDTDVEEKTIEDKTVETSGKEEELLPPEQTLQTQPDQAVSQEPDFAVVAAPGAEKINKEEITDGSDDIVTDSGEEDLVPDSEGPVLKFPEFKIEAIDPSKATLSFEPYHTIDYFASQGIKVKEEEKPRDKFSQQLKSFTEWIKAMKKLPPTEMTALQDNIQEEKKVEQLAAHSISDQKVLTEAMAEVWEKQGNFEKATEVYRKLSLLDPSKSAYFAAKIEHLKKPS